MGRPALHTADSLVDTAVRLFGVGGLRAVTMAAVAREAGAPSGSVYHRFPDRPALLAQVWLCTTRRFEDDFLAELGPHPDARRAVAAAVRCVDWCRERPAAAQVLHAGVATFSPHLWRAEDQAALVAADHRRKRLVARTSRDLAAITGRPPEDVSFALFDLPLALLGRHLAAGAPPPRRASEQVQRLAATILGAD
jgi:AcrR family transcriptional regulator